MLNIENNKFHSISKLNNNIPCCGSSDAGEMTLIQPRMTKMDSVPTEKPVTQTTPTAQLIVNLNVTSLTGVLNHTNQYSMNLNWVQLPIQLSSCSFSFILSQDSTAWKLFQQQINIQNFVHDIMGMNNLRELLVQIQTGCDLCTNVVVETSDSCKLQ